ncbi:uncharacterized protein [Periplaneta americana]|uniref:uncharacterized protein isoform X2 n=1 Tax=Periplaneta americana TaxID=6978 RepID=UPI0037E8FC46
MQHSAYFDKSPEPSSEKISSMNAISTEDDPDENHLMEMLKSLECPFNWLQEYEKKKISRIQEKLEEMEDEELFPWRKFNLRLILSYEYCREKSYSESLETLQFCEKIITSKDHKGIYENLYQDTKDALCYIIKSCKCHLYFAKKCLNEVKQILPGICKYEEMNNKCKAAIWGVRAIVMMEYGPEATKSSYDFVRKAKELDPRQQEWLFLEVKCLGRIRRFENYHEISEKELNAMNELNKNIEKTKNPGYLIFLAQAYREISFAMRIQGRYHRDRELRRQVHDMNQRSVSLYRQALRLRPDCGHINYRCAEAFFKFTQPFKDVKLAKECRDKALQLAPSNIMANHIGARIYELLDRDIENAKKYYKKAAELGGYGAHLELYKLYYQEDNTYDPIPELEKLLERFQNKTLQEKTLCQMGSYYCFIKNDLPTAYKYWRQVMDDNPDSKRLKNHKCSFIPSMKTPINIYELLFDEARITIRRPERKLDEDTLAILNEIISTISERFPQLANNPPVPRRRMAMEEWQ